MKIIPLSLFFAGITLFSCSNESTNNLSTNSQKVKLNKNEVLSIAYDDAKELTDKDIFNMVSSFANMNNNGVSRSTSASFKITKRTYINKEGEFQTKQRRMAQIHSPLFCRIWLYPFVSGKTRSADTSA